MSLTISLNNKLRRAVPRRQLFMQVLRRAVVLILLGIVLNSHKNKSTLVNLRVPGVLQRIGVTYLVVGIIESLFAKRSVSVNEVNMVCLFNFFKTNYKNNSRWLYCSLVIRMKFMRSSIEIS